MAVVVAAMSGGVDSSVAAALLQEQGHEVIGVHMKLHGSNSAAGTTKTCCGLDDALDARQVAERLGIPFYVLDLQEAFKKAVMDDLADEYLAGRTPNPCVMCNGVLKFKVLLARAMALGASHLATGHYARVGPGPSLMAAVDPAKDQSYFLYDIRPEALARTLFPLGGMTKPEVRAHAERLGLITASKPDSQEICFIPDGDHARFIREHRPVADEAGEIVDAEGRVLGFHDGWFQYTVGQRRGLGVALGFPAYVLRVEPETRRVVVGDDGALWREGLVAHRCTWIQRPPPGARVSARVRHRGALVPCTIGEGEAPEVRFEAPVRAIAPGQAVVFYDGDRVLGGGRIREALGAGASPLPQASA